MAEGKIIPFRGRGTPPLQSAQVADPKPEVVTEEPPTLPTPEEIRLGEVYRALALRADQAEELIKRYASPLRQVAFLDVASENSPQVAQLILPYVASAIATGFTLGYFTHLKEGIDERAD